LLVVFVPYTITCQTISILFNTSHGASNLTRQAPQCSVWLRRPDRAGAWASSSRPGRRWWSRW